MSVEAGITRTRALLLEAALQPERWPDALSAFAEACGAHSGQLIVRREDGSIPVHMLTGMPDGFASAIQAFGLSDRTCNPRLELGLNASLMTPVLDQDHVNAEDRRRTPIYGEMFVPFDVPYNCQAVLARQGDALVRASVSRSHKQGPFDADAMRAFSALTPAWQALVRLHTALAWERLSNVLAALDASATPAVVVDHAKRVSGATRSAEPLLENGPLRLKFGRLDLADNRAANAFARRLSVALDGSRSGLGCSIPPIVVGTGSHRLQIECFALPSERDLLSLGPAAIILIKPMSAPRTTRQALGCLTDAETDVALRLCDGQSLKIIAAARGVARPTVRSQLQSIFSKLGVTRQAELVRLLQAAQSKN